MNKVVLITGASSGIGKAIASSLIRSKYTVYCAARSTDKMEGLVCIGGHSIYMDVTDEKTITDGINKIIKEQGRIDILINNAGFGFYGPLETIPIENAKKQMDVNVFGLARVIQLVLPVMRKQNAGKIINISSIAGKITSPLGSWYFASKHAVEGLSDSLRQEIKPFGIDVIIIEPGGIKSDWAKIASQNLEESTKDTPYSSMAKKVINYFPFIEKENSGPYVIADLVQKAIDAKNPQTRYVGGTNAKTLLFLRKILPDKLFDSAVSSQLKL